MQTAAKSSFVLTEFFSFRGLAESPATKYGELYQQIISGLFKRSAGKETIDRLAQHLAELAHHAYNLRQLDTVKQASHLLIALPEPWKHIGSYYQAKCLRHEGRIAEAGAILERVAEQAPLRYRARAVQFMGAMYHTTGQYKDALPLYEEAYTIAKYNWCDPHTVVTASQNIAILRSIEGDHKGALIDLEKIFPLVEALGRIEPYKYHHYLNSFSVELLEVGRFEEAHNVCKIVLASPYAFAYPEWRETGAEIARRGYKSRSFISFTQREKLQNVLYLPEPSPDPVSSQPEGPARLLSYVDWKEKMGKSNGEDKIDTKKMSEREMLLKIIELTSNEDITAQELREILDAVIKVTSKRR